MSLIVPAATAAATTATLWFIPILVAAVSFYQYDKTDPEGRPKDTKVMFKLKLRTFYRAISKWRHTWVNTTKRGCLTCALSTHFSSLGNDVMTSSISYKNKKVIYKYYDFIVIGAGSAGAVVANRLSEQPDWNVLLLEAGGDETETSDVPALAAYLQLSELDWQYKTEPQPTACLAFNDKRYLKKKTR